MCFILFFVDVYKVTLTYLFDDIGHKTFHLFKKSQNCIYAATFWQVLRLF